MQLTFGNPHILSAQELVLINKKCKSGVVVETEGGSLFLWRKCSPSALLTPVPQ